MPTLRVRALADLARQLRFGSAGAARKHLGRAEGLLAELLEARAKGRMQAAYPEEWVEFRVTGLRRERAHGEEEGGSVVAEALLGDLAGLIDRLSSAAKIGALDLKRGEWIGIEELAKEWGVSRKTVERMRRRGLASRRVTQGRGRERVVFSRAMVEAYERACGRPEKPAKARRIPKSERARIVHQARRMSGRLGWSMNRSAARLAARHGRARETVRQVLIAEGVGADGRGSSRATRHRAGLEEGLAYLRTLDLRWASAATFERADAAEVVLAPEAVRAAMENAGPDRAADLLALVERHEAPAEEKEAALAAAYGFLLWRARGEIAALRRDRRRFATRIAGVERDLLVAARVKAELVREQLPGALRSAESRLGMRLVELGARGAAGVLGVVIDALSAAIDRFDPFKGGRLAGSASVGVGRAVGSWVKERDGAGERAGRATVRGTAPGGTESINVAHRGSRWAERLELGAAGRRKRRPRGPRA